MKSYENLKETLAFYGVNCNEPYYISSGNSILKFPKKSFRIDFYAFCICLAGNIELEIDNNTYNINQNGFLISAPSTIIKFKKVSKDFRMKLLFFSKDFLLKNIANPFIIDKMNLFRYGSYNILEADIQQAVPLYAFLDYLQIKTSVKGKFTEEIIRTIIFNLLLEIAEIVSLEGGDSKENKKKKKELFLKFDELVKENILLYKDVGFYAKQLCISDKYLIEVVKKATGKTPHQIIDEALLKEAYVMLGNPGYSITQIADLLQFSSVSAFGRFFKKYASISPTEYRRQQNIS
ncbi:AraC-type DNA-binding protein [Chitinophaga terrae (ex Kim and Jung 2007)]|uniref:AraC-type DNA-binding protein n=1 Tax=Chitinophaga terrae (ex Kim and Jung 2007) TaxID=408074 RepID=A0A1H4GF44_9BACT|nr:helix-turn-helix domain-containing protein [Chitinophaga terrae (ex Kim and Jung 2007)]GEP93332.1 AraC family transcriptional regulator [Chitinophaga terrae (ex Kim and Jung 2007)]SEB07518.1 AraC-type DNA-binding protein [Chitinophaga terrae (ex Kim and Jung 2007)]